MEKHALPHGILGRSPKDAYNAQKYESEDVPEARCDPIASPTFIQRIRDFEIHLHTVITHASLVPRIKEVKNVSLYSLCVICDTHNIIHGTYRVHIE